MGQDEAFEFFMEVKNKEIEELKDKLERNNAAANAMINAGMRNKKLLKDAGDALAKYVEQIHTIDDTISDPQLCNLLINWDEAKEGRKGLDL